MKKYFFAGLATLLPLAVTIYVVILFVNFLTSPFMDAVTHLLERVGFLDIVPVPVVRTISQILILIGLFLFTILLGAVARWFLVKNFIKIGDVIMRKIPLLNKIYKTTKDIVEILFTSKQNSFKQVVMVRFPYQHCYSLGLIVREGPKSSGPDTVSVFIPTTPNPTTGFLILSHKSELIYLQMKSEEAIKYVVSCGVIQPGGEQK